MSYYFKNKYNFSNHAVYRAKTRLKLNDFNDLEIVNFCSKLIDSSYEVYETATYKYIKVNKTNLYFVFDKIGNLVITLSPFKPDRLLALLEKND